MPGAPRASLPALRISATCSILPLPRRWGLLFMATGARLSIVLKSRAGPTGSKRCLEATAME